MSHQEIDDRSTLQEPKDLAIWKEVRTHPEFTLKPEVFDRVGDDLHELLDQELTPQERCRVISEIRRLHESNRSRQHFEFSVHKHYETRHSHAETPAPDPETTEAEPTGQVVDAIAFREAGSIDDGEDVMKELDDLGLLGRLLGEEP